MKKYSGRFSAASGLLPSRRRAAFTLVEVVMALGVFAISFIVLFSLMPVGLDMMTSSSDATVGMQIVQRVTTLARQAKFSELSKLDRNPGTDSKGEKPDFFFDNEGVEVADAVNITDPRVIYSAAVLLQAQTTVPGAAGGQITNPNIATINIIFKKNARVQPLRVFNALIADNGL